MAAINIELISFIIKDAEAHCIDAQDFLDHKTHWYNRQEVSDYDKEMFLDGWYDRQILNIKNKK